VKAALQEALSKQQAPPPRPHERIIRVMTIVLPSDCGSDDACSDSSREEGAGRGGNFAALKDSKPHASTSNSSSPLGLARRSTTSLLPRPAGRSCLWDRRRFNRSPRRTRSRGEPPDLVLTADPGAEKPETYEYQRVISLWMAARGIPYEVVRYVPTRFKHWPPYYSILANVLTNATLPSISLDGTAAA
jgi:hypothetical protein